MFGFLKSKGYWLALIVVTIVLGLFATIQFGVRNNVALHQVPIAIVNQDKGAVSTNLISKMTQNHNDKIKWVTVKRASELAPGYAQRKYYGALIIKKDFSKNIGTHSVYLKELGMQAKAGGTPTSALKSGRIELEISQGANASLASALTAALPQLTSRLNQKLSGQTLMVVKQTKATLSQSTWEQLNNPIRTSTKTVNTIPTKSVSGMLPFMLTVLCWLGSMILSLLLWREFRREAKPKLKTLTNQLLSGVLGTGILSGVLIGFINVLGTSIPASGQLFWVLWANMLVYYLLITVILDWFGYYGYPLVILVWLLAAAALGYAPQMLPDFAEKYIYSWVPMRYGLGTLTDNLYFNGQITNSLNWVVIAWMGVASIALIYLVVFKGRLHRQKAAMVTE